MALVAQSGGLCGGMSEVSRRMSLMQKSVLLWLASIALISTSATLRESTMRISQAIPRREMERCCDCAQDTLNAQF